MNREAYLNLLPKCSCGEPATIQERNVLTCAPCALAKVQPEIDALEAERTREAREAAEALRIEEEREALRQSILNPPEPVRTRPMADDDRATVELNRELLEKFRRRKAEKQLEELGLAA